MAIIFFEGFETSSDSIGLANQSTSRPHVEKRFAATTVGAGPADNSFFLIDDTFDEGYALQMGSDVVSGGNTLIIGIPSADQGVDGMASDLVLGALIHIPVTTKTFTIMQVTADSGGGNFNGTHLHWTVTDSTDFGVSRNLGPTLAETEDVFTPGNWHYVEMRFKISEIADGGEVECFVDDTSIFSETGLDTRDFWGNVNGIRLLSVSATTDADDFVGYDDIYLGNAGNFEGARVRIHSLVPDGDGTSTDWTTSTGTVHYTLIDENGSDTADYVETSTNLDEEMFDTAAVDPDGDIICIKVEVEATDTATGINTMDVRIDSAGTIEETNHPVTSTTAYEVFSHYADNDPDTGTTWTTGGVNAMEVGAEFLT